MPACLVQVDATLLWNGVDHFDLVNVVSSQLGCLGGILKAQIHYALLDSMLVVSLHLKAEQVHTLQMHCAGVRSLHAGSYVKVYRIFMMYNDIDVKMLGPDCVLAGSIMVNSGAQRLGIQIRGLTFTYSSVSAMQSAVWTTDTGA